MSLRPGARWSPQTQGIAGGIGSAVAGVSDQIRRVMQDRPVSSSGSPPQQMGAVRYTQGPTVPFSGGSASWTVPDGAVSGLSMAVFNINIGGVSGGSWGMLDVIGATPTSVLVGGETTVQLVTTAGVRPLVALTDGSGGQATFAVLAW